MQVWGEFDVARIIITARPFDIWNRTENAAGVEREAFVTYFAGRTQGHAIEIVRTRHYAQLLDLARTFGVVPQSFVYLDD